MNGFAAMSPRRRRLVVGTTGAFAACALLPGTGPSLRHNLSGAAQSVVNWFHEDDSETGDIGGIKDAANPSPAVFRARLPLDQAVATRMSDDFAVQLAACERSVPPDAPGYNYDKNDEPLPPANVLNGSAVGRNEQIVHKLHDTLASRFGSNPAFHAAVLRNLAFDAVRLNNRNDANVFDASPAPKNQSLPAAPPPTPENLRLWHDAVQAGERLEPQNAYFPLMEAVGFFAENRDSEGEAALLRASEKNTFEGHDGDAPVGLLRLEEAEGRDPTAIFRLWVQISRTLPDYAALQNLKYIAAAKAVEAEQQNRPDDGFRIRQALRRVGATMRENCHTWSGTWLGHGFVQAACLRPGGEAPIGWDTRITDQTPARETKISASYQNYLRRTNHAGEADAIAFEERERIANGALFRSVQDNPAYYMNLPRLLRLLLFPTAGLVLVCGALGLLMAGGFAALLARTRNIAHGLPLPGAVQNGAVSAVLLPIGFSLALTAGSERGTVLVAAGMVAACGVGVVLRGRRKAKSAGVAAGSRSVKPFHTVFLWIGGFAGMWALAGVWGFLAYLGGQAALAPVRDLQDLSLNEGFWGFCALSACVTPVLLSVLAVCSRKVGVPASVGMVRGLRGLAVPVACIMVLLTMPLWIGSARENAALNRDLKRVSVNESRYIADIENKPWPLHARPVEAVKTIETPRR